MVEFKEIYKKFKPPREIYWNYIRLALADKLPPSQVKNGIIKRTGVKLGENVFIGPKVIFDPVFPEYIHIGNNVFLGQNARLFAHMIIPYSQRIYLKFKDMKNDKVKYLDVIMVEDGITYILVAGEIWIDDNAFIGPSSSIYLGTRVGESAVIGSTSLVLKDIPSGKIVGDPNEKTLFGLDS